MSDIWTHKQMEHLPELAQAKKAITHTLCQIRDRGDVGYLLGIGSETFALLTEAYAALHKMDVQQTRESFQCEEPVNPRGEACEEERPANEITEPDMIDALRRWGTASRIEFFTAIRSQWCMECGGWEPVRVGACGCEGGAL